MLRRDRGEESVDGDGDLDESKRDEAPNPDDPIEQIAEEVKQDFDNAIGEVDEELKKNKEEEDDFEDVDSDDEYQEIEIKKKLLEYKQQNPGERFPENMMNEAVRWRLNQNDCQNRGYVLDGYPKSYATAEGVFVVVPPRPAPKIEMVDGEPVEQEVDEEEIKQLTKPQFQKNIYPDSVILLRGDVDMLYNKIHKLPED